MVAVDMRLCARQIQRYYHAEGENPQKDCISPADLARAAKLQPIFALEACEKGEIRWVEKWSREDGVDILSNFCMASSWTSLRMALDQLKMADNQEGSPEEQSAVEEKANYASHQARTPRPSSPRPAPAVNIPQETNPWQDAGADVPEPSEALEDGPPEVQSHNRDAWSCPPAVEDQSEIISTLDDDSQPPLPYPFVDTPWNSRRNQHEGAVRNAYPPADVNLQDEEYEGWLGAASEEFEPVPDSRYEGQVPQTDHDVEELLTPENFAKYKRYRRREKRAGRG